MDSSALKTNACPGCDARDKIHKSLADEVDRLTNKLRVTLEMIIDEPDAARVIAEKALADA